MMVARANQYDINKWLVKQHPWLQEAALRLQGKKTLSNSDISDFVKIIMDEASESPDVSKIGVRADNQNVVSILSVGNVKGIDRLNPRNPLVFASAGLSVVYGRNGSGKSGYARIIKRACGKTDDMLRPNIYKLPPDTQTVDFKFMFNDEERETTWIANGDYLPELSSVGVFDGEVGSFYLQRANEAAYTPQMLLLFSDLAVACDQVANELETKKQKLISKLPTLPKEYTTSLIAQIYNNLGQASKQQIQELSIFSEDDSKTLLDLQERLGVVDATKSAQKLRATKKQVDGIIDSVTSFHKETEPAAYSRMIALIENAKRKQQAVGDGAKVLQTSSLLDGVGKDTWKALWEAARTYSTTEAYNGIAYPNTEERAVCVLCHQELTDMAKERMQHFEAFVQGQLEADAKQAENDLNRAIQDLPAFITETEWTTKTQAAELIDDLSNDIWAFYRIAGATINQYREKNINGVAPTLSTESIVQRLTELSKQLEKKAVQFDKDAQFFNRDSANQEVLELKAKQWVAEQKDAIDIEIRRIEEIRRYDKLKKKANTRAITTEAGIASEELVTNVYISRFNSELEKLGASSITVELVKLRNEKGKGKYRVQLKNTKVAPDKPAEILSDGEKRIVSLAAFLADVTGKDDNVPFVFDDPVSSLDQEYEEATARRLVELSQCRQVIAFTHRLSFLGLLTEISETSEINTICINDEIWGTGEPSDTPINAKNPKRALNKLLNEKLLQAKSELENNGTQAYEPLAQAICSDFRKLIERMIELVLMNDIVQRHRRSVQTLGKIQKLAVINKDDCELLGDLMTKYSAFEHSQSNEFPVPLPRPDTLKEDIENAIVWHDDFKART